MKDLKGKVTLKTFPMSDKLWIRLKKEAKVKGMKLYAYLHQMVELGLDNVGK